MSKKKKMRDRLIKLLQDNSYLDVLDEEHWLLAAEQLLANGVVVIDTDVVSPKNRPLISQCMGRPIDEVINLIRRSEWISVEDGLPDRDGRYLVAMKNGNDYHISTRKFKRTSPPIWWKGHTYGYWARQTGGVRYWMPLPEAPKKGSDNELR